MVEHNIYSLYENAEKQELIFAIIEDRDGYIHYRYCQDPTQQEWKMTETELLRDYELMRS